MMFYIWLWFDPSDKNWKQTELMFNDKGMTTGGKTWHGFDTVIKKKIKSTGFIPGVGQDEVRRIKEVEANKTETSDAIEEAQE